MLEMIVDNRVIYVVTGCVTALGVAGKIISNLSLKRMVKAAGNMSKSNHTLMRLVRAKFEHACMVSEKVENVPVFVDKYLYEYKAMGMKLHTWRRMQKICVALCLMIGLLGAFLEYSVHGMNDEVIRVGAYGGILGILLYLFHMTSDESYRMSAVRNYMVDYLENVCLHKYEKQRQKDEELMRKKEEEVLRQQAEVVKIEEVSKKEPVKEEVVKEKVVKEAEIVETAKENLREIYKKEEKRAQKKEEQKEEKKVDKDILIRQILEEFMA